MKNTEATNKFHSRLQMSIEKQDISASDLARMLQLGRSTISNWTSGRSLPDAKTLVMLSDILQVSVDWLLGVHEQETDNIRWNIQYPNEAENSDLLTKGLQAFTLYLASKLSTAQVQRHLDIPRYEIRIALRFAFETGIIRLVDVARDVQLETDLRRMYPSLTAAVVANLSEPFIDSNLVRTEIVAFLAAKIAFKQLRPYPAVGIGGGYTLKRMIEITGASFEELGGTSWVSLNSFPQGTMAPSSSDYLVQRLANLHANTKARSFSNAYYENMSGLDDLKNQYLREAKAIDIIFGTTTSLGIRDREETVNEGTELLSADGESSPFWDIRHLLGEEIHRYVGNVMDIPIDSVGEPISYVRNPPFISPKHNLQILRDTIHRGGRVWVIAARLYKAEPTYVAIKEGLVNAVVIDSEIAKYILERGFNN